MKEKPRNGKMVWIETQVYRRFQKYCEDNVHPVSKLATKILETWLNEKEHGRKD